MVLTKLSPALVALALAGCAGAEPMHRNAVTRVVATTSFGMCVGYCTTRLEIVEGQATLIREARAGRGGAGPIQETQRFTAQLSDSEWQDIQRMASGADFAAMPEVVGCPDCADGGAESLTVERPDGDETVSFEYGAMLAQAEPLLGRVRALRNRLTPQNAD